MPEINRPHPDEAQERQQQTDPLGRVRDGTGGGDHVALRIARIPGGLLRGQRYDPAIELQLPDGFLEERSPPVPWLQEPPVPFGAGYSERDAGEAGSRADVDAGALGQPVEKRNEAERVFDVAGPEVGQVARGDKVRPGRPEPHQGLVPAEFCLVRRCIP